MPRGEPGPITAVAFDLGGVLIDWNPRHLYRPLFAGDEEGMERFLADVCTMAWNEEQDAGRPFAEGVRLLALAHPQHAALIEAYDREWPRMLNGPIHDAVALLAELRATGMPLYALSNWSSEKYPIAEARYAFLEWFDGIMISGAVKLKKPDRRLFDHFAETFGLTPGETLFIDDSPRNVAAARAAGYRAIRFESAEQLGRELTALALR